MTECFQTCLVTSQRFRLSLHVHALEANTNGSRADQDDFMTFIFQAQNRLNKGA